MLARDAKYSHTWNTVVLTVENPTGIMWHFHQLLTLFIILFLHALQPLSPSSTWTDRQCDVKQGRT